MNKFFLGNFILLFIYLSPQALRAQTDQKQGVVFQVDKAGALWINNKMVSRKKGVDAPVELIDIEGDKPVPSYGSDRYVWHAFKKIGVFFERRNDPSSDGMAITLPLYPDPDLPEIKYRGILILENSKIDFVTAHTLTKKNIRSHLKGDMSVSWMDETTLHAAFGRTAVYLIFDAKGLLQRISISVPEGPYREK